MRIHAGNRGRFTHSVDDWPRFVDLFSSSSSGIFLDSSAENLDKNGMDLNIGVIRDRQGIYSELLQSQSMHRQLAVCYSSEGNLLVKISVVSEIIAESGKVTIVLQSSLDPLSKTAVSLEEIQSIYPITDYIG